MIKLVRETLGPNNGEVMQSFVRFTVKSSQKIARNLSANKCSEEKGRVASLTSNYMCGTYLIILFLRGNLFRVARSRFSADQNEMTQPKFRFSIGMTR